MPTRSFVQSIIISISVLIGITWWWNTSLPPKSISAIEQPQIIALQKPNAVKPTELQCLAENIYHEAGNQPDLGKVAVGVVTINRTKDGNFPRSVCGVVKQSTIMNESGDKVCQFSWVCDGDVKVPLSTTKQWNDSKRIAKMLLEGGYDQNKILFENAKYFHAASLKTDWKKRHAVVAQIGDHVFYR